MNSIDLPEGYEIREHREANYKRMHGMACTILRNRGFTRKKESNIFFRHTVGLGGIYVHIEADGFRIQTSDFGNYTILDPSELADDLDRLDSREEILAEIFTEKIQSFGGAC